MAILVVMEQTGRVVSQPSLETAGMARMLAERSQTGLETVVLPDDRTLDASAAGLNRLVTELTPDAVLAPASERGMEVMAMLAARRDLPLANNCIAVEPDGESWTVTRIRGAGVLWEDSELVAMEKMLTIAPGVAAPVASADLPETRELPDADEDSRGLELVERTTAEGGVTLTTAPVVVSGGRGVGSAEGFAVLDELAGLLGGAVGCSRVVTNNGWRPHSDQVGQTGAKVSPELYIAAGISGATQHWAGCMGSKTILAINTDPEAPMVTRADYAVIGDVQQVLHAVVAEFKQRASQKAAH